MATKRTSRRGGGSIPAPTPTISPPRQRPPSPLSPTRIARVDEKKQMQHLNNRLASYIEAVRIRDLEIQGLRQEKSTIEESHTTEITQVKTLYDKEIRQLRVTVDGISREKAKLEMEVDKATREAQEAKSELKDKEKRLHASERELASKTTRLADVEGRLKIAEDELRNLRPENQKLTKKLEDAKRNLEDETLKRTDLQNQLLSQEEGLKFENSMLEQQLNETKIRKQMEISEIDGRLSEEYERKLQESLQDLRNSYETQMSQSRQEFSTLYEDKLQKMQQKLDNERQNLAGNVQEVREMTTKVTALTSKNMELESSNVQLQKRMADILKSMEDKDAEFRNEMARKDAEVRNKDEQMEEMLKDYRDLVDIKTALDMEIAAYRKMLDAEETRLGISPTSSPAEGRGVKRRRTYVEEEEVFGMVSDHSGQGTVTIEPLEKGAKCIRLKNRSDKEVNIGGWTLTNSSGVEDMTYKFHRSTTLAPGSACTIYSADADETHDPPNTLIMKKGGWVIGATNKTVLANKDGVEEACRLSREEKRQSGSFRSGYGSIRSQDEKSCAIM